MGWDRYVHRGRAGLRPSLPDRRCERARWTSRASIASWKRARARTASPRRHRRSYSRPSSTAAWGAVLDGPSGGGARRLRHSRRPLGRRGEQPGPGPGCRPRGRGLDRCDYGGRDPPALRGDRVRRLWFPRCCSRPGLLSDETTLAPRRTPTGAPGGGRRRGHRRDAVWERCRMVADAAAAPSSRVALRRARRQPRGGAAGAWRGVRQPAGTTTRPTTCRPAPPRSRSVTAPRPTRCNGRLWRPERCAGAGSAGGVGGCAGRVPGQASRPVVRRGQRLSRLGPRRGPRDRVAR
jgi:hypothetical protein